MTRRLHRDTLPWSTCALATSIAALAGCGEDAAAPRLPPSTTALPPACGVDELPREDGGCRAVGLPRDMPCPPAQLLLPDGRCQPAGVPRGACSMGFVADDQGGCDAVLPADPCPTGQMATLGEVACREVAPCGAGTYGDIPVDETTQFVDGSYAGEDSDGTQQKPWTTVQEGIDAAAPGAIVALAAGRYVEDVLVFGKSVRLWGRCPSAVELVGTDVLNPSIRVLESDADATEVRGIAIAPAALGVAVSGARSVRIEQMWVHGASNVGIAIFDRFGRTSASVRASLIERSQAAGLFVAGADATIDDVVVRRSSGALDAGYGIVVTKSPETGMDAAATVRAAVVEQNRTAGILVDGATATVEGSVVRATRSSGDGFRGYAIAVQEELDTRQRATVTIRRSLFAQNHDAAILVGGSDAAIEACTLRDTQPGGDGLRGYGIAAQAAPGRGERANVTLSASLIEGVRSVGVYADQSDATIEATVVRDTLPGSTGDLGYGVAVQGNAGPGEQGSGIIRASLLENNHGAGLYVTGADAAVEASIVRAPGLGGPLRFGDGLIATAGTGLPTRLTVTATEIVANHRAGVLFDRSAGSISSSASTKNRFGLVSQRSPDLLLGEDVLFKDNTERDEIVDRDLEVPDRAPSIP